MIHRNIENQRRLKKIAVYKRYKPGIAYFDKKEKRYIKTSRVKHSKYLKKYCNRKVRRYSRWLGNGGLYKKVSEYWYELY